MITVEIAVPQMQLAQVVRHQGQLCLMTDIARRLIDEITPAVGEASQCRGRRLFGRAAAGHRPVIVRPARDWICADMKPSGVYMIKPWASSPCGYLTGPSGLSRSMQETSSQAPTSLSRNVSVIAPPRS